MQKVEVYISTAEPESLRVKDLSVLFKSSLFNVHITTIPNSSVVLNSNFDIESYRLFELLKKSPKKSYVLILKDNSITTSSSHNLDTIVKSIITENNWDLCYLSFWLDRCDLYGRNHFNPIKIPGINSYLTKSSSPNGIQALMFSPNGKNIALGIIKMRNGQFFTPHSSASNSFRENIEKGAINALVVLPTVFSYDILQSKSVSDLAKLSMCRRPNVVVNSTNIPGTTPLFWYIAIIVITVLILLSIYYLSLKKNK
uniref:Glycosyltransferase family 25 n=1 Tax=Pithovirus LCPAC001 TaxID=2506585 RepID=A0A481Z1F1_9VIRU|nr:MAG: glycosyltransferase family 25 [Pithovirus LCPAC001]